MEARRGSASADAVSASAPSVAHRGVDTNRRGSAAETAAQSVPSSRRGSSSDAVRHGSLDAANLGPGAGSVGLSSALASASKPRVDSVPELIVDAHDDGMSMASTDMGSVHPSVVCEGDEESVMDNGGESNPASAGITPSASALGAIVDGGEGDDVTAGEGAGVHIVMEPPSARPSDVGGAVGPNDHPLSQADIATILAMAQRQRHEQQQEQSRRRPQALQSQQRLLHPSVQSLAVAPPPRKKHSWSSHSIREHAAMDARSIHGAGDSRAELRSYESLDGAYSDSDEYGSDDAQSLALSTLMADEPPVGSYGVVLGGAGRSRIADSAVERNNMVLEADEEQEFDFTAMPLGSTPSWADGYETNTVSHFSVANAFATLSAAACVATETDYSSSLHSTGIDAAMVQAEAAVLETLASGQTSQVKGRVAELVKKLSPAAEYRMFALFVTFIRALELAALGLAIACAASLSQRAAATRVAGVYEAFAACAAVASVVLVACIVLSVNVLQRAKKTSAQVSPAALGRAKVVADNCVEDAMVAVSGSEFGAVRKKKFGASDLRDLIKVTVQRMRMMGAMLLLGLLLHLPAGLLASIVVWNDIGNVGSYESLFLVCAMFNLTKLGYKLSQVPRLMGMVSHYRALKQKVRQLRAQRIARNSGSGTGLGTGVLMESLVMGSGFREILEGDRGNVEDLFM